MASKSSLDEKLSDLVGATSYNINERMKNGLGSICAIDSRLRTEIFIGLFVMTQI